DAASSVRAPPRARWTPSRCGRSRTGMGSRSRRRWRPATSTSTGPGGPGGTLGIIDESDLLVKVHRDPTHFNDAVKTAMTNKLETLPPKAKIKDLLDVFDRGRVAIVMEDDKFLGLITRTDLLSYLRLHMPKQ